LWLLVLNYAAIFSTLAWYALKANNKDYCLNYLSLMLWGATLMAFVDHIFSYARGEGFFELSSDSLALGFSLVAVALMIWLVILLYKDPLKVLKV
jgi:uncharacterized protein (DUF486 family)